MKTILTLTILSFICIESFSQSIFTSRKGSKFFPGHLDIVITVDSNSLRYELFNHWYAGSYAELRQISIPLGNLDAFNQGNDTLHIDLRKGKVKLQDKRYHLSRKVRHRHLCARPSTMRKISFAYNISSGQQDIRHFELYKQEDLQLEEEAFKEKVLANLKEKLR